MPPGISPIAVNKQINKYYYYHYYYYYYYYYRNATASEGLLKTGTPLQYTKDIIRSLAKTLKSRSFR